MPSSSTLDLPVIDFGVYLEDPTSTAALEECKKAADALMTFSALAVKTPNVSEEDNAVFLNLMEDYFSQSTDKKLKDARPEHGYQVGSTPELTEIPKCGKDDRCTDFVQNMTPENKPQDYNLPDPKWRFFWRIGEPPKETKFSSLNLPPVIPEDFPAWESIMNSWGNKMHSSVSLLAEMVAIGLGISKDSFTSYAENGPHLLAPTGSDLQKYGQVNTVLAGFHYDFNLLTIHGKSRFPGLHIWERSGKKLRAKIPDGCLLVQAGKEMEWLTGGRILAGYHEVVVIPETIEAIKKQEERHRPLWRISSTLFYHVATDMVLKPFEELNATANEIKKYPESICGDFVNLELGQINLKNE